MISVYLISDVKFSKKYILMHIFILEMNIRRISLNAEAYKNRHNNELHKSQRHFDFTTDIEQTIAYRPYAKEAYLAGKKKAIL
ncbi:hypothetical protein C9I92_17245 [Photobacterium ganghwense]|uniref:Uncharacterized protein n=1 Tax=Photobacterium ganghwense TaxID=320778 RepID=A0A0J1K1K4_9GAMM|nr:hypothetical protein ABT57_16210 [Photobacterium ganghwense]PSU07457.1 hypothetical protein C9I92_17245 [Photobacterium ganghwense]